jgi:hypothetical protein
MLDSRVMRNGQGHTKRNCFFLKDKPRGALPLTKCHFFHSILWVHRILGGDGGWWIEERGERSAGHGITEM